MLVYMSVGDTVDEYRPFETTGQVEGGPDGHQTSHLQPPAAGI